MDTQVVTGETKVLRSFLGKCRVMGGAPDKRHEGTRYIVIPKVFADTFDIKPGDAIQVTVVKANES